MRVHHSPHPMTRCPRPSRAPSPVWAKVPCHRLTTREKPPQAGASPQSAASDQSSDTSARGLEADMGGGLETERGGSPGDGQADGASAILRAPGRRDRGRSPTTAPGFPATRAARDGTASAAGMVQVTAERHNSSYVGDIWSAHSMKISHVGAITTLDMTFTSHSTVRCSRERHELDHANRASPGSQTRIR
jgi:hypothetical protein